MVDIRLVYEDDGFYQFAVTTVDPIPVPFQAVLFRDGDGGHTLACLTGAGEFEMGALIEPLRSQVTAPGCE